MLDPHCNTRLALGVDNLARYLRLCVIGKRLMYK